MNYIRRLQIELKRARAESSALRAGLYALQSYAASDKYGPGQPGMNPADVILRVDEALFAAHDAESEVC